MSRHPSQSSPATGNAASGDTREDCSAQQVTASHGRTTDALAPDHLIEVEELERHGLLSELSRRRFLQASSALAASLAFGMPALADSGGGAPAVSITLKINGKEHALSLDPRTTLLDALREDLDLTGTKKGCDHGQCGACTVLVNGRRVNSCLTLALAAEGSEITTIEGLARTSDPKEIEDLSPVQAAFLKHDGYQCGYCTPGQIVSATAAITEQRNGDLSIVSWRTGRSDRPDLTDDEIAERMSGNICRCGAYPNIVAAVRAASKGATA
jgi:xanthine dehydrogenase YagT iron-sulfur-binding subunit